MKFIILSVSIYLMFSCSNSSDIIKSNTLQNVKDLDTLKGVYFPKQVKEYEFKINNQDVDCFSFSKQEFDQAISIKQVLIIDNKIYFIDSYHSNVKGVDIKTGRLFSSVILNNVKGSLNSFTYFNNKIMVFSNESKFYTLDTTLRKTDKFDFINYRWNKDIFRQNQDTLTLYRPVEDIHQMEDKTIKVNILKLSKNYNFYNDSLFFKSFSSFKETENHSIRGKKYNLSKNDNGHLLSLNGVQYYLKGEIPTTSEFYDTKNIDINFNKIAYFEINESRIKITLLLY